MMATTRGTTTIKYLNTSITIFITTPLLQKLLPVTPKLPSQILYTVSDSNSWTQIR